MHTPALSKMLLEIRLCVHALGSETVTETSAGRWERKISAQQSS